MIVEKKYETSLEDFDKNGQMKMKAILRLFENTGSKQADLVGDGILSRSIKGTAWVLTDWQVQINQYPKHEDEIVAKTWSEPVNAIFTSSRNFELYVNNNLAAIATTRWAIIDLTNGRPTKIGKELIDQYQPEDKKTFTETKLSKIEIPETCSIEKQIIQRRSDIDFNNHVHNLTYLDYALETLPQELYDTLSFKNIRISYKTQLQYGENTICRYTQKDGKHIFNIYGNENTLRTQIELS